MVKKKKKEGFQILDFTGLGPEVFGSDHILHFQAREGSAGPSGHSETIRAAAVVRRGAIASVSTGHPASAVSLGGEAAQNRGGMTLP